MVVQTHPRLILALVGPVLMASTLACGRPGPRNAVTRYGNDVVASGSAPQVVDSVPGDAILAGGRPLFSGATGGDYIGAGGNQTIGGRIHGSVRAAGGELHITATVDRNATIAGGNIALDRTAVIGRNAYLAGGTIQVDGAVREVLQATGGTVILNGVVGRDVEVAAGALRVGPHAQIAGNLRYRVPPGKVQIDPAAHVLGTVTALPAPHRRGVWYLFGVLWMVGFLVAGAVLVTCVPRVAAEVAEIMREHTGRSALVGLGWFIVAPAAMMLVAITIIGLPLALLAAAVYLVLVYVGRIAFAVWLGQRVLGTRARTGRQGVLVNFLVGGVLLLLVRMVPVVGALVLLVATVLGLGALLLRVRTVREE